uniref:Putative gtp-binding protein alpha subunit n=1 Tax=Schistosoma mansoni TaxID=6183 RepID=A0A3Q0KNH3_SCHMA
MNKELTRKRSRYHSHKIDKFLLQEYEHRKKEIQLLLIGLPNSGKNTFCKQMRLHFGDGFPISYRNEMKSTILANTTDAIAMVLEYMKDANITFSDILAHRLQEYLVNSRSENGWITKDFIIFDDKYTATTITTNNMDHHNLQRQESSFKANLNNVTDHLTSPYDYDHHSITTSSSLPSITMSTSLIHSFNESIQSISQHYLSSINIPSNKIHHLTTETNDSCIHSLLHTNTTTTNSSSTMPINTTNTTTSSSMMPINTTNTTTTTSSTGNTDSITDSIVDKFLSYVHENNSIPPSVFKKFESIIGIKSMENWRDIIENKTLLHHLIHVLLQSGIDNWSSFLMYQSGPAPPPAPTTLPPLSVEDELLDYIVMSDSYDTSEDGDDDNDHERDDTESGLVNSSNSSLVRTLVKSTSYTGDIDVFINYDEDDDDDDDDDEETRNNLNEDWNNLVGIKTEDGLVYKSIRKLSINTRRRNKSLDNHNKLAPFNSLINNNYIELNSHFNLLKLSMDQLNDLNYLKKHKISLNSLQIIMKIITDQIEFRNIFIKLYSILEEKSYSGLYFIKCIDRIIQDDYIPTLQDLLIMKQSSKAVRESLISIGSITLRTINLGEQSEHLNKQFHYFESVNMILFFISLEDVYRFTYIQGNKIIHHPSFKLFEDVIHSPDLTKKDIIIGIPLFKGSNLILSNYIIIIIIKLHVYYFI